jgi:hypothetical protein
MKYDVVSLRLPTTGVSLRLPRNSGQPGYQELESTLDYRGTLVSLCVPTNVVSLFFWGIQGYGCLRCAQILSINVFARGLLIMFQTYRAFQKHLSSIFFLSFATPQTPRVTSTNLCRWLQRWASFSIYRKESDHIFSITEQN